MSLLVSTERGSPPPPVSPPPSSSSSLSSVPPSSKADQPAVLFCGETARDKIRAAYRQRGLTDKSDCFIAPCPLLPLNVHAYQAVEARMGRHMKYTIDGKLIRLPYEMVIRCYEGLISAKAVGGECFTIPGSDWIVDNLTAPYPEARELFTTAVLQHLSTQFSDSDTHCVTKKMPIALIKLLSDIYLLEHVTFEAMHNNGKSFSCTGVAGLLQANWLEINYIRMRFGAGFEEKTLPAKQQIRLAKAFAGFATMQDSKQVLTKWNAHWLAVFQEIDADLYPKLGVFIRKEGQAFEEWHEHQVIQTDHTTSSVVTHFHRMSCEAEDGLPHDFICFLNQDDEAARVYFQKFAVVLTDWMASKRHLAVEGDIQGLYHKVLRIIHWVKSAKGEQERGKQCTASDYFYYMFLLTRDYQGVDAQTEVELKGKVPELWRRTPHKAPAIAAAIDQELGRRHIARHRSHNHLEEETKKLWIARLNKLAPDKVESLLGLVDEELSVRPEVHKKAAHLSNEEALYCKIEELGQLSDAGRHLIYSLIDWELASYGQATRLRSKAIDPGETIAFLFNACNPLSGDCSSLEISRVWRYLSSVIPSKSIPQSIYACIQASVMQRTLDIRTIGAALELLSFRSLGQSAAVRQTLYLQPLITEHNGQFIFHTNAEGHAFHLGFDLPRAMSQLCQQAPKSVEGQAALEKLLAFASPCDPLRMDAASPLLLHKNELGIDFASWIDPLLLGSQHQNAAIRSLSHDLLIQCLGQELPEESWKKLVESLPLLFRRECEVAEQKRLASGLTQRLKRQFGKAIEKKIDALMKQVKNPKCGNNNRKLLHLFASIPREPFLSIALEKWKSLRDRRGTGLSLLKILRENAPQKALELLTALIEDNDCSAEEISQNILQLWEPLMKGKDEKERLKLIYGWVDLLASYDKFQPNPSAFALALKKMNAFFEGGDPHTAITLAQACDERHIVGNSALIAAIRQLKKSSEQLGSIPDQLATGWIEAPENSPLRALHLYFFECLMRRLPANSSLFCERFLLAIPIQQSSHFQAVLHHFVSTGFLKHGPEFSSLLLRCCDRYAAHKQGAKQSVALYQHAVREGLWTENDYRQEFEGFLELYRKARGLKVEGIHEMVTALRSSLLDVNPSHPELNEEARKRRVVELLASLKGNGNSFQILQQLFHVTDPAKDGQRVLVSVSRTLPQLLSFEGGFSQVRNLLQDPVLQQMQPGWADAVLEILSKNSLTEESCQLLQCIQDHFPQVDIQPLLKRFPVATASVADVKSFSALLQRKVEDPELVSIVTLCIKRLLEHRMVEEALTTLVVTELQEDALWLACLQKASGPKMLRQGWQAAEQKIKKWNRYGRNPKSNSWEVCQMWLQFEAVQCKLLLALIASGNRDQEWKAILQERLGEAQNSQRGVYTKFAARGVQSSCLLIYLEQLLPEQPERYAQSLFDEICAFCASIKATASIDPKIVSSLDERMMRCALLSRKRPIFLKGLERLEEKLDPPLLLLAIQESASFLPRHADVGEVLERVCQTYADSQPKDPLPVIDALAQSRLSSLVKKAVDLALQVDLEKVEKKATPTTFVNLIRRLLQDKDMEAIPKVITKCASCLSEEQLTVLICDYLDLVQQRQDGIYPPAVAFVNQFLSLLSSPSQMKCLDKALDHWMRIFTQPMAMEPWGSKVWELFRSFESSSSTPAKSSPKLEKGNVESDALFSPHTLFAVVQQHFRHFLASEHICKNTDVDALSRDLDQKMEEVKERYKDLSFEIDPKKDSALFLMFSKMVIAKALKLASQMSARDPFSKIFLLTMLWRRFELLGAHVSNKHREWMPQFVDYAICPLAHEEEAYFPYHRLIAIQLIESFKKEVLDDNPLVTLRLGCFLNLQLVFDQRLYNEAKQSSYLEGLLEKLWGAPSSRDHWHTLFCLHFVCTEVFIRRREDLFRLWYGRIFDQMHTHRQKASQMLNLICHFVTDVQKKNRIIDQIHRTRWREVLGHFAYYMSSDPAPFDFVEEKSLINLYSAVQAYLTEVKRILNGQDSVEMSSGEEIAAASLEGVVKRIWATKNLLDVPVALEITHFACTFPIYCRMSSGALWYHKLLDEIKKRGDSSWRTIHLVCRIGRDLNTAPQNEQMKEIHRTKWQEVMELFLFLIEHPPQDKGDVSQEDNVYDSAWRYLVAAEALYKDEANQDQFARQQIALLQKLKSVNDTFFSLMRLHNNRPQSLLMGESLHCAQISYFHEHLMPSVRESYKLELLDIVRSLSAYMESRIRNRASVAAAAQENPTVLSHSDRAYKDIWFCAMTFLSSGRALYVLNQRYDLYFGQVTQIFSLMGESQVKHPIYYIHLFKLLTDKFTEASNENEGLDERKQALQFVLEKIEVNFIDCAGAAAYLYLQRLNYLQKYFEGDTDAFLVAKNRMQTIERLLSSKRIATLDAIDLKNL